jgi:hypothetical protein
MTETANISFFTIFCNLFSVGIKSGTWTIAPEWTAQVAGTVTGKRKNTFQFAEC